MPTVNNSITITADDASAVASPATLDATGVIAGNVFGTNYYAGLRFLAVAVPQGATITSATLTLIVGGAAFGGTGAGAASGFGNWKGVASDNAPTWSTANLAITTSRTTASATILGSTTVETTRAHDVTSIVQEIVNRAGWVSGNALAIAGDPTGATSYCPYYDYVDNSAKAATLSITYASGGGGTGTASITLAALTASGTGKVTLRATSGVTLSALTSSGTGKVALKATAAVTLGALTVAGTGRLQITGTGAAALSALTVAGTGALQGAGTGSAAVTLGDLTAAGAGVVRVSGAGAATLATLTGVGAGSLRLAGSGTAQLGTLSAAGTGALRLSGSLAATLDAITIALDGQTPSDGSGSISLTGSADVTLADVTLAATGILVALDSRTGSLAITLGTLIATGTGRTIIRMPTPASRTTAAGARQPETHSTRRRTTHASRRVA